MRVKREWGRILLLSCPCDDGSFILVANLQGNLTAELRRVFAEDRGDNNVSYLCVPLCPCLPARFAFSFLQEGVIQRILKRLIPQIHSMSIFGPSQKDTWNKVSDETNSQFIKGGFWKGHKIVAQEKNWTITLDTFVVHAGTVVVPFTRMRAPFLSKDSFRFKMECRNFFSSIADFFGRKRLTTGYPELDERFVIKTTDEFKLKKLLANENIRQLIVGQKEIQLEIKDDDCWPTAKFPSDVDELYFHIPGVIKDQEKLKSFFRLFSESLNQLVAISSASERGPEVVLK